MRSPNGDDTARLMTIGESRGFPSMHGSIDCMHWRWKNCPLASQDMYIRHVHEPTLTLKVVVDKDIWI